MERTQNIRNWVKWLNLIVGISFAGNLYLVAGLFRIPYQLAAILLIAISLVGFVISFDPKKWINHVNFWVVAIMLGASLLLGPLDAVRNQSEFAINDALRIVGYFLYFAWTSTLLQTPKDFRWWVKGLFFTLLAVLIVQGIIENWQPLAWAVIMAEGIDKRSLGRIAGTLIDSNTYACTLVLGYYLLVKHFFSKHSLLHWSLAFIGASLILYLVNASGSRQAILLLAIFASIEIFRRYQLRGVLIGIGVFIFLFMLVEISQPWLVKYYEENPASGIARILVSGSEQSERSNIERSQTLIQGWKLVEDNYYVLGSGIFNFSSRWRLHTFYNEPHNGFLYLLVQYGIFSLLIFYFYGVAFMRAIKANAMVWFLAFMVHFFFQPNSMYYCYSFLTLFLVDYIWQNPEALNRQLDV